MSRKKNNGIKVGTKGQAIDSLFNIQDQRYKDLEDQNKALKESLKQTQDKLEELKDNYEKLKNEKFELEKKNAIYENQKGYNILLEILKFISSLVLGGIAGALFSKQYSRRLLIIGIPFGILYIACLVIPNLKTKIIK